MKVELPEVEHLELFDWQFYSRQAGISFRDPASALDHYHTVGWTKGLNPSKLFDTGFYLRANPDVLLADIDPLTHFVLWGRAEGRSPRSGRGRLSSKPVAPSNEEWRLLSAARPSQPFPDSAEVVDVIIPVYKGFDDTLACIHSVVVSENRTPYRLLVIDDVGPDEKLSEALRFLAELGLIQLETNRANLGFVGTANKGMKLSKCRDVLLLNSDTVVYHNWIDRLRSHAKKHDNVATVTPFSNNATILSYPRTVENNNTELEIDYPDLDNAFRSANHGISSPIITGVGFCFYINRPCLDDIGYFDESLFGRGYGEENDFCMRASKAGWENLAAWDTFVRHTGEVSFGSTADDGKRVGYAALLSVHPEYDEAVHSFIKSDPLRRAREAVDVLRAQRAASKHGVLFIEHARGGGTNKHVQDLASALNGDGVPVLRAHPTNEGRLVIDGLGDLELPNLPKFELSALSQIADFIASIGVHLVHFHSFVDFPEKAIAELTAMLRARHVPYYYTVHDYAAVCPRINMIDWGGIFCGSDSKEHCERCLKESSLPVLDVDITEWRRQYRTMLDGAVKVLVPHPSVAEIVQDYLGELPNIVVRSHFEVQRRASKIGRVRPRTVGQPHLIGIVGAIGPNKGSSVLLRIVAEAWQQQLPLRFKLFGYSDRSELDRFPNFSSTGPYRDEGIDDLIAEDRPDLLLYLSVWPETFCYALDISFRTGIAPVVFDLGAQAGRVRGEGFGAVIPLELSLKPRELCDNVLAIASRFDRGRSAYRAEHFRGFASYYDLQQRGE